ncbi:hypothetical protein WJX74_006357 [Apatococcus lobatus]|uniref:Uncharacterized protein n=1 Tax=Apatococcus lobatus TaxID=904363 RepID=A0AAW1Q9A4_9CHLO
MGPVHNQGKQSGLLSKRQRRKSQATRDALSASGATSAAVAAKSQFGSGHLEAASRALSSDPQTPPAVDTRKLCSEFAEPTSSKAERSAPQKNTPAAAAAPVSARPYVYPIDANSTHAALNSKAPYAAAPSTPGQLSTLADSQASSIFSDSTTLQEKVNCILDRFQAMPVVQRLIELKVPELVAQRACLEVAQSHSRMDTDAALDYIKAHNNPAELNRHLHPLELLKYQDVADAVTNILEKVPGINHQSAHKAVQDTIGTIDAAASCLARTLKLPYTMSPAVPGQPFLIQGISAEAQQQLTGDAAEVMQCMANAVAKASELEMATEQLRAASQAASHLQPPSLPSISYQQPQQQQQQHHLTNHQHLAARSTSLPVYAPTSTTRGVHQANGVSTAAPTAAARSLPAAGGISVTDARHPLSITSRDELHLQQQATASQPVMHVVQPSGTPNGVSPLASQQYSPQQAASPLQMHPHQHQHSSSLSDLGDNEDDFDDGLQGFEAFRMPDWVVQRQQLLMEVDELRQHKDWADRRIDALLKRATGAERPQIAETNRLRDEVTRLRQEKDKLEQTLRDFERSLQKLKDCTYHEATQKQECEKRVRAMAAELRGASLREQEVSQQLSESQGQLKQEKKRGEVLHRQLKKVQDERTEAAAQSGAQDRVAEAHLARIRLLERVVEERAAFGEASEAALIQAKHTADNKMADLFTEKASIETALEHRDRQLAEVKEQLTSLQAAYDIQKQQIGRLREELIMKVETPSPPREDPPIRQNSFYSHWNGSSLFGGSSAQPAASTDSPRRPLSSLEPLERASSHGLPLNGSRSHASSLHAAHSRPIDSLAGCESGAGLSQILSRMSSLGLGSRSPSPYH